MNGKAIVVGGGISGLSVAYSLMKEGIEVSLFEKELTVGGFIRSERREGYLLEQGPNSLLNLNSELEAFCHELGLEKEKIFQSEESKSRYILKKGKMIPLPRTPREFFLSTLLSLRGKVRLLREPFISPLPYPKTESISQFVKRRFGTEFLNYVVDPMIEGIYAGDPEILSMPATFSRICALEEKYGSLLKGFIKKRNEEKRKKRIDLFSFKNGMGSLTHTLSLLLGKRIESKITVTAIMKNEGKGKKFILTAKSPGIEKKIESDIVILATPSYVSGELIYPFDPLLSKALQSIIYAPIVMINFGFSKSGLAKPFSGSGCLIPKKEELNLLGFRVNSNLYPDRAPADKMILTCFLGGMRNSEIVQKKEEELIELTLKELKLLLGIEETPQFVHLVRHPHAIPQYDLTHHLKVETIEKEITQIPGLYLAGNYLRGVSVWDCLSQGLALGKLISVKLKEKTDSWSLSFNSNIS